MGIQTKEGNRVRKWSTGLALGLLVVLVASSVGQAVVTPNISNTMLTKFVVYDNELAEASRPMAVGTQGVITTGNINASLVGYEIIRKGGNAFDAGVAAAMALKVTKMHYAGWCGITPFIGYNAAEGKVSCYAGVGVAPAAATPEFYEKLGYTGMPDENPILCALTPSEPDSYCAILERWGTMSFTECIQGALDLAENGFPAFKFHVSTTKGDLSHLTDYNKSFWLQYGRPAEPGELIVNKDLAKTFRILIDAEQKALKSGATRIQALEAVRDCFYKGDIAKTIARYYKDNGGIMTYDDLANYHGKWYDPIKASYKGVEVYGTPTWTQCGLVIQYLNMLDNFDVKKMGYASTSYIHLLSQVIDLGQADRVKWFGDPDFVDVSPNLWSKEYAKLRTGLIDMKSAFTKMPPAGDPYNMKAILANGLPSFDVAEGDPGEEIDTTYLCVIDKQGNIFSMTPSDGHVTSPMIPGLGFGLSNRMTQFSLDRSLASIVAPGKRPMVTPNPVLGLKDGKALFALGTPGGDQQAQSMIQVFLNWYEFGMDVQQAIDQPRFGSFNFPSAFAPYTYYPGRLAMEGRYPKTTYDALAALGHKMMYWPDWTPTACAVCMAVRDPKTGLLMAGADVRRECYAVGW